MMNTQVLGNALANSFRSPLAEFILNKHPLFDRIVDPSNQFWDFSLDDLENLTKLEIRLDLTAIFISILAIGGVITFFLLSQFLDHAETAEKIAIAGIISTLASTIVTFIYFKALKDKRLPVSKSSFDDLRKRCLKSINLRRIQTLYAKVIDPKIKFDDFSTIELEVLAESAPHISAFRYLKNRKSDPPSVSQEHFNDLRDYYIRNDRKFRGEIETIHRRVRFVKYFLPIKSILSIVFYSLLITNPSLIDIERIMDRKYALAYNQYVHLNFFLWSLVVSTDGEKEVVFVFGYPFEK